jgi:flagellum-specific peptidoglycan hydrolase FlgJ
MWASTGLRRALLSGVSATAAAAMMAVVPGPAAATTPLPSQVLALSSIRAEQDNLVTANHQAPLGLARLAVSEFTADTQKAAQAVAADRTAQTSAEARSAAAAARLGGDRSALAAAVTALARADQRLADDRAQLRVIAVGMYTGALTNPQPSSLQQLEAEQARIIDSAEVAVVAGVVDGHVHTDLDTAAVDTRRQAATALQVASDQTTEADAASMAAAAAARTGVDAASLATFQSDLSGAGRQLDAAEADLTAALDAVAGPPSAPPGELSILGGAALSASQLAGWYNSQGYVDLTAAPIEQLAAWYLQAGAEEGVRGDVAFAQAMLETGGFSSPDAVDLSNFAGIGHCDTCAAGWAFPSPYGGVLGQVQLLRIFADAGPGPAHAPPPVLASLTPAQEQSAGCCPTIESLTGVWATDPTYGQQILGIYGQMLGYALSTAPA